MKIAVWFTVFVLGCTLGMAQEARQLDEMKVTALARDTAVTQTPGGISIADAKELFEARPLSISDLSLRLPGVSKSSDAHWGSEINIRGLSRNRIVFVADGQRVNTATDVAVQYGLIMPEDIERVEILKGPVSELYGSGSMGGVVNVRTAGADFTDTPETHGKVSFSTSGNPRGFSTYTGLSYSDKDFWVFASGGFRDYNSYKDGGHNEVKHSYMQDEQISLKGGYKWDAANVTEIALRHYKASDVGVPGAEGLPGAASRVVLPKTVMDAYSLKHIVTPESGFWTESMVQLYYQKIDRDVNIDRFRHPATAAWPRPQRVAPSAKHETYGLRWNNIWEFEPHTLVWGLDAWRWEYTGSRLKKVGLPTGAFKKVYDVPMADSSQNNIGLYAEDNWHINDAFTLNFGARADRVIAKSHDLLGPAPAHSKLMDGKDMEDWSWSAHAGLTWNISQPWSMTLLLSRANRIPDILDRFKYISLAEGVLTGTPGLDDEESWFAEYGIHYKTDTLTISASAYVNRINSMVAAVPVPGTVNQVMDNVDKALLKGLELQADWNFANGWNAYGYIAWMEGDDLDKDVYLRNNPPANGLFGLRYKRLDWWWALEASWASRQDHNAPGYDDCDAWLTANAMIGYTTPINMGSRLSFLLAIENIFNAEYTNYLSTIRGNNSALAYQEPGRCVTFTVKFEF